MSSTTERDRLVTAKGGTAATNSSYTAPEDAERGAINAESAVAPVYEHDDDDGAAGEIGKSIIFGALDGVLTSFAIVAGAAGGGLGGGAILILGFSGIVANGVSLGVGEYLSSKAHNAYVEQERQREEWELRNHREAEIVGLAEAYVRRGMSVADADVVVRHLAKYDRFFVDSLMSEELGMPNYRPLDEFESCKEGLCMFIGFTVAGALPLLAYAIAPYATPEPSSGQVFAAAVAITAVALFAVGAAKSAFSARSWFCAGLETLVLGGACAGVAYEVAGVVLLWVNSMDEE